VLCADFNGDGRTDTYVANDASANLLWLNQGDGTFRESALDMGVAYSMDGLAKAGMGVTLADVENNVLPRLTYSIPSDSAILRNTGETDPSRTR
jgi:enediyne biosynthesis protein E4